MPESMDWTDGPICVVGETDEIRFALVPAGNDNAVGSLEGSRGTDSDVLQNLKVI